MNIVIRPGAATEDAAQIDSIISTMMDKMTELNAAIDAYIDAGNDTIQQDWGTTVKLNWKGYYNNGIPEILAEMAFSAENLRKAVDEALAYSQQG